MSWSYTGDGPAASFPGPRPRCAGQAWLRLRIAPQAETLATRGKLDSPLPLVREAVAEKGPLVAEAHFAFRTLEWARPRAGSQMSQQILHQAEALPALLAPEVPLWPGDAVLLLLWPSSCAARQGLMWQVVGVAPLVLH